MTDDLRSLCSEEFIKIASRYDAEGWIEYLLWETLEGKRDRPFRILDPLSEEEMDVLRVMRDEVKFWLYWDQRWTMVEIGEWRTNTETRTSDDVFAEMQART